ncbi:hypothetical protein LXA43DRAFT_1066686 [Ganoderma leucocontextum]|nr:hypothetical protein LXA43DRAFT_1066686 [Ganoderma leucocontextum]
MPARRRFQTLILVYDWLLCLGQEVIFIWNWQSKVTGPSLVYAFSRYATVIQMLLAFATNYLMSDLAVLLVMGTIASSAFSALRAYALSNRNIWLTAIIILLTLPPIAMIISVSLGISGAHYQLTAELLVIGITWWYTYQSYRIRQGIKLGKTISSLLIYNASVPPEVLVRANLVPNFYDPITSILTCHFMLSLRQFDSNIASTTYSRGTRRHPLEHTAATDMLQFTARRSDSLPGFITSFAHPVHVDPSLFETDAGAIVDDGSEWREMDVVSPTLETPFSSSPTSDLEHSV